MLFVLLLVGLSVMAQNRRDVFNGDTITFERDTTRVWRTTEDWGWMFQIAIDSLTGTKDGLLRIQVAEADVDSLYKDYDALYWDSLTTDSVYMYSGESTRGKYWRFDLTLNSITKWHITYWLTITRGR